MGLEQNLQKIGELTESGLSLNLSDPFKRKMGKKITIFDTCRAFFPREWYLVTDSYIYSGNIDELSR